MTSHCHPPTQPMAARSALRDAVLFEFDETGADGEPRRAVVQFGDPAVRATWQHGLTDVAARAAVWAENPTCDECGAPIAKPTDGGLLPSRTAIVCKSPCFIHVMSRINPTFKRSAAVRRAGGR